MSALKVATVKYKYLTKINATVAQYAGKTYFHEILEMNFGK